MRKTPSYRRSRGGDSDWSGLSDAGLAGSVLPGETTMKRVTLQQEVEPAELAERAASRGASRTAVRETTEERRSAARPHTEGRA